MTAVLGLTAEQRRQQRDEAEHRRIATLAATAYKGAVCPACGAKVTATSSGGYRPHGPRDARCPGVAPQPGPDSPSPEPGTDAAPTLSLVSSAGAAPNGPTERDLAVRLVALRVLADRVKAADLEVRAQMQAQMVVGDRVTATLHPTEEEQSPTVVGHVQLTKGRAGSTTATVTDEQALLAWVTQHHPTEVVTTESVRRSFLTVLLEAIRNDGGWYDKKTGEQVTLPGVDVISGPDGTPTLAVKPTPAAAVEIPEAWADGRLAWSELTALPAGEQ